MIYFAMSGLDSISDIWYRYLEVHELTMVSTSRYAAELKLISYFKSETYSYDQ